MTTAIERAAAPDPSEAPGPARKRPPRLLFLCLHNTVRSPMAEALARARCSALWPSDAERLDVRSAGAWASGPVDPLAAAAMDEVGLDIRRHRPLGLTDIEADGGDLGAFDLIVALSPGAAERLEELLGPSAPLERWRIDDPAAADGDDAARLCAYRTVRDALDAAIAKRLDAPI